MTLVPSSRAILTPYRQASGNRKPPAVMRGVSDGARTRDTQDHNLVLYLLSYAHHRRRADPAQEV
jgi:hypothetical protein